MLYALFCFWLLLDRIMCLRFTHVVCINSSFFILISNNPVSEYITTCPSIRLLVDIFQFEYQFFWGGVLLSIFFLSQLFYNEIREGGLWPEPQFFYEFQDWVQVTYSVVTGHLVSLSSVMYNGIAQPYYAFLSSQSHWFMWNHRHCSPGAVSSVLSCCLLHYSQAQVLTKSLSDSFNNISLATYT